MCFNTRYKKTALTSSAVFYVLDYTKFWRCRLGRKKKVAVDAISNEVKGMFP